MQLVRKWHFASVGAAQRYVRELEQIGSGWQRLNRRFCSGAEKQLSYRERKPIFARVLGLPSLLLNFGVVSFCFRDRPTGSSVRAGRKKTQSVRVPFIEPVETGPLQKRLPAIYTIGFARMPFPPLLRPSGIVHAAVFAGASTHPTSMPWQEVCFQHPPFVQSLGASVGGLFQIRPACNVAYWHQPDQPDRSGDVR
jgi:hypothetical protein